MKLAADPPQPPSHLSPSAADWWRSTVDRYVLEEHHLRLLRLCCEAWDEAQTAREQLGREGLTVPTRDGGLRAHPCVAIERDARLAVVPVFPVIGRSCRRPIQSPVASLANSALSRPRAALVLRSSTVAFCLRLAT